MKTISSQTYTTIMKSLGRHIEELETRAIAEGTSAWTILELEDLQAAIEDLTACLN